MLAEPTCFYARTGRVDAESAKNTGIVLFHSVSVNMEIVIASLASHKLVKGRSGYQIAFIDNLNYGVGLTPLANDRYEPAQVSGPNLVGRGKLADVPVSNFFSVSFLTQSPHT